ncbi:hypothetical protein [Acidovorax sp.]|uniref:hypothetical protein n=1 Tax=Acidovorax sp. TaxID=1872122 RepID=UPI004037CC98
MAISIVTQSHSSKPTHEGLAWSKWLYFDAVDGTVAALVGARLITPAELEPQERRAPGYTAFLPGGKPCPPGKKAWRTPGYRAIRQREDGTIRLEITVSKEAQAERRAAKRAQEYEVEQARINDEIEQRGHLFRGWKLAQFFGSRGESWEGTKTQLQAAGLGVGMQYPGEPGAKKQAIFRCPLGFEFRVSLPLDRAKAAAGIYLALSDFAPGETQEQRREVRQAMNKSSKTNAEFREERAAFAELALKIIWREVFCKANGATRFDLPEDGAIYASLGEAFQAVRDAIKHAPIISDAQLEAALKAKVGVAAARNDSVLQAVFREAMKPSTPAPLSDAG